MNPKRLLSVWSLDVGQNARRPIFWILLLINGFVAYGLSTGNVRINSGDSSIGGTKAWITSEFAAAQMLTIVVFLFYSFFIAVTAGMSVIHDDELKVGELLHATPLRPREYIWGKFLGTFCCFLAILLAQLLCMMFFNHMVPDAKTAELVGPFDLANYLRPTVFFTLPMLLFLAGTSFAIGELTRKPILVFVLPVALILVCGFFLWQWAPAWLDPRIDRILMLLDPAGFRWLNQTWLKTDRGTEFYNHARIPLDAPFLFSRLALATAGLLFVWLSQRHLTAVLGGLKATGSRKKDPPFVLGTDRLREEQGGEDERAGVRYRPLADLGMRSTPPGFFRGAVEVARAEFRQLRSHPGLYLFVPIILLQVIGTSLLAVGAFDTPLLATSGTLAVGTMNTLTLLICLLLLFYTVESVHRERHTLLASIHYATPVRSSSILFGKAIANSLVAAVILVAAQAGCWIVLLVQGTVGFELRPFLVMWGILLLITFLAWTSFIMAVLAFTGNRCTTYAVCLAALIFTGYRQTTKQMNWVGNWDLWDALRWSDMQWFGLDGMAVLCNRLMVLGLAIFFTALAVKFFRRREADGVRTLQRLQPLPLVKSGLRLLPWAIAPLVAGTFLWFQVYEGFQGDVAKKAQKDYWRKNLATWKEAPLPAITAVDLDVDLEPAQRWFHVRGHWDLRNHLDHDIPQIPVTVGDHWRDYSKDAEPIQANRKYVGRWTLNGVKVEPDNQAHLYVFTPTKPLAPGKTLQIGFEYEGTFPRGITKNGGNGTMEFIQPSAVVLTAFTPSFVPVLGYMEEVGIDDDNRYERRVYPDRYYEGITEPLFGSATAFTTRIGITAPEEFTLNSVGTRVSDTVVNGRRTSVWQSDYPVRFFNIVAGRWAERRGRNTVVYYHPGHAYNIDEISEALDAARQYYSEWFYPYPWRELKLSEFPDLASYAQGFGTNITFSEGIGFLTKSDLGSNLAFIVTAHEAAHQWWGNIVVPGKGPGGNILAEGMAHFSTLLLCEQVHGPHARIEFAKRIEDRYGQNRRKDSERPLVKIDGDRPGDTTVTYDKGGWVFWMLLQHMGRERALAGLQAFVRQYALNPDHPVLEDFVAVMRKFAPDLAAYDAFVHQWFFEVVLPEYRPSEARCLPASAGTSPTGSPGTPGESGGWEVTVHVQNAGTGCMPVEIAALAGDRFLDDGSLAPDYHDARSNVVLAAGQGADVTIHCNFKPDRVVIDPDALVLQLFRKAATVPLER